MTTLVETFVAGLVGTALMTLSMYAIHGTGWANADMIRALGSLVSRSKESALAWGVAIHAVSGMLFAIPYAAVLGAFERPGPVLAVAFGAILGFFHGLLMSLVLLAAVSERHPVEEFREAGLEVAVAHILGHVAYGAGVGLVVHVLGIDWGWTL